MNEEYDSLLGKKRKYELIGGLLLLVGFVSFLLVIHRILLDDVVNWHIESLDLFYIFLAIAGLLAGTLYIYKGHILESDIKEVKMLYQGERDRSFNERRQKRFRKREEKRIEANKAERQKIWLAEKEEIDEKIKMADNIWNKGGLENLKKALIIYSKYGNGNRKLEIEIAKEKETYLDYENALLDFERLGLHKSARRVRQKINDQKEVKVDQTVIHGDYVDDRDTIVKDSVINRSNIGPDGKSKAEELREAKSLFKEGLIDHDEFKQMKKEILGK